MSGATDPRYGEWWDRLFTGQRLDGAGDRVRQERIESLKTCTDLREAMRLWSEDRETRLRELQDS